MTKIFRTLICMPSRIVSSDSYIQFLAPPPPEAVPDHIRNILPDYMIIHILGSGGFANVYKAIGLHDKEVALKIPKTEDVMATMDMSVMEKFKSESDIWKKLDHGNIVKFFNGDTIPMPHIAMELMDGGSLSSLMKNHKIAVGEAVHIMLQLLEGLSYAHRMATVHRDLKPENILFTSEGVPKITDWGIGKFMASATMSKTVGTKGTLNYCAPEQFDKRKYGMVDWQTDIFQVGIIFYEMLTGVNPFAGVDMADVMGKVLMEEPLPPSSLNPDVSPELDEIIMGTLRKRKENRLKTDVILFQLNQIVDGNPIKILPSIERKRIQDPLKSGGEVKGPLPNTDEKVCPQCGNIIALENKKLRCTGCKTFFCETCDGWISKIDRYNGYRINMQTPLCENCYKNVLMKKKRKIDLQIKALKLNAKLEKIVDNYRRKGLKVFSGFNKALNEITELINRKSYKNAIIKSKSLIISLENYVEKNKALYSYERLKKIISYNKKHEIKAYSGFNLEMKEIQGLLKDGIYKTAIEKLHSIIVSFQSYMRTSLKESDHWKYTDNYWQNSVGMRFVKILGSNHYFAIYPVTQKEWQLVMSTTPWEGTRNIKEGDDYPASHISWNDAQEFVRKLNEKEDVNKYRLPSEEEWEDASRPFSLDNYCFGNDEENLKDYAWYCKNTSEVGEKYPHRVGLKKPNEWELYDMHGNVWEWCQNKRHMWDVERVLRGGGWLSTATKCSVTKRYGKRPGCKRNDIGFRVLREE